LKQNSFNQTKLFQINKTFLGTWFKTRLLVKSFLTVDGVTTIKKSSVLKAAIVNGISNADCKAAFGADGVRQFKSFTSFVKWLLLNTKRELKTRH
jgi:hypothetical protein